MKQWVIDLLAVMIAVVWATSVVFTYADRDYRPPPTVHLVMMAMVGAVFGAKVFAKMEKKENDDPQRDRNSGD